MAERKYSVASTEDRTGQVAKARRSLFDIFRTYDQNDVESQVDPPRPQPSPVSSSRSMSTESEKVADKPDFSATLSRVRERILKKKGDNNFHLSRFDETVSENGWSDTSLALLEDWLNKCESAATAHTDAALIARRLNIRVAGPSIVLGAAASALAFFSVGDDCDESDNGTPTPLSISIAVLTSMFSILGGFGSLFGLAERHSEHISAAAGYNNLAKKIQVCLFLPLAAKSEAEVVLTDVSGEFFSLHNTSPLIYNGF